jgi:hypothetical protein
MFSLSYVMVLHHFVNLPFHQTHKKEFTSYLNLFFQGYLACPHYPLNFRLINMGNICWQKCQRQQHVTVLALATLDDATKNRNDPISVTPTKVA